MKPQTALLYTRDCDFDCLVGEALAETETVILPARTVAEAFQIIRKRGRDLAFALMDFDGACRGMMLLSAVHSCFEHLPILVTTSNNAEHVTAIAYANGATACLRKPTHSAILASAITEVTGPTQHLTAA